MKKNILLTLFLFSASISGFCTVHTVVNSGTTFNEATITISLGDTVVFAVAGSHDAREVNQNTWNANGTTPLPNGFQTPFGGGMILPNQLGVGTHFYVCSNHASMGMKGQIIVENTTNISENKLPSAFSIYPNPATDLISIKADSKIHGSDFSILDQMGRKVIGGQLNKEATNVDISALATGIYTLQIGTQKEQTFKVLKK